ncbi:MAG: tyrosine-type recombinase/integrase [Gammaproteobacteria bacterium]
MVMGRRRTHDKHLPRGMTLERGSYFYRGADRKRVNLGRDFADAMARYGELFREAPLSTFGVLLDRYLQLVLPGKAAATRASQLPQAATIRAVFGHVPPKTIKPTDVYAFRDRLKARSGAVQANQHLALLKHVCTKGIEWGALVTNPARDVRKNPVKARTRYVTDAEVAAVRDLASPMLRCATDLAVLTGLRRGDLLRLTRTDCQDDGIHVATSKTGRVLIIEWSTELRAVVEIAKRIKPHFRQHILATRSGKPFSSSGFSTAWQRLMVATKKAGIERFHFHDLRGKSASDSSNLVEASERLGHSSLDLTRRVYRRKPLKVTPLR